MAVLQQVGRVGGVRSLRRYRHWLQTQPGYDRWSQQKTVMTKTDAILTQFRNLNVWHRQDERAPHKPLLVLLALGRLQAGAERLFPFDELEQPLSDLLEEFGPPRRSLHPELPFFHLQSDGVWELQEDPRVRQRQGSKNPLRTDLRKFRVRGGFPGPLFRDLKERPEAVRELARSVLGAHFPDSLHDAILSAVGLDLSGTLRHVRRDPSFRAAVISAWGHQCVFCGYSVQLDSADLGLEAAHIRWCQAGGPDSLANGLSCCSIHHQAFDRGAVTISDSSRVLVSSRIHGSGMVQDLFLALHGRQIHPPARKAALPAREYLEWHRKLVFRGEARD